MTTTATAAGPAGRMVIARGLESLRSRSGLTLLQAADAAGCSKSTAGRYEQWQDRTGAIRWQTVRDLAQAYGATDDEVDVLVRIAKNLGNGWWVGDPTIPEWMDPLLSFEAWAAYEHIYANGPVHGLLQTRRYALALHQAQEVRASAEEIHAKVELRLRRQDILKRQPPLHLWVVLDEAVLHRLVGGAEVMAEQMAHLMEMARQPDVDLQVLPYSAGAHAAAGGHFVVLGNDDERVPLNSMAVAYVEMHRRGVYLDDPDDLAAYKLSHAYLRSQAADTAASYQLLARAHEEFSR